MPERPIKFLSISIGAISAVVKDVRKEYFCLAQPRHGAVVALARRCRDCGEDPMSDFAVPDVAMEEQTDVPVEPAGRPSPAPARLRDHRHFHRGFSHPGAVRQGGAATGAGIHSDLSIGAAGQRPDHRGVPARPAPVVALARLKPACRRLSVHRADVDRACAHVSRPVRANGAARCRAADHSLALHVLAQRLSALRHRLHPIWAGGAAAQRGPHHDLEHRRVDPLLGMRSARY